MTSNFIGVLWALTAVVGWGFGDYLIQKNSRELGIWKCLFFISLIGVIGLLPFVWGDLHLLFAVKALLWMGITGIAMTAGSIFVFESFKEGKLSIMEPVISAELPIAVLLSITLWHENLSLAGWLLVLTIFLGVLLAVTEHHAHLHYHKRIFEKGVAFAAAGALVNGFIDLLMGASSQEVSPLLTVWSVWLIGAIITFAYIIYRGEVGRLSRDFMRYPREILVLGILDTGAWVGFTFAAVRIPISITAAITEGYIIIAILMGLVVSREQLRQHQRAGAVIAAIGVILLAATTG